MEKMEDIWKCCLQLYQTYEKQVKIAVVALVVVTALLLFGENGEKQEIIVESAENTQTEEALETETTVEGKQENTEKTNNQTIMLVVDISGCVKNPGVYRVTDGARLHEIIQLAGGLTKDADIDVINQAETVTDGQKILIPAKTEAENNGSTQITTQESTDKGTNSEKININQADSIRLQEIPGVGPATAEKIIQYRDANGRFQTIEDIKNVSGIGDKTFEKMKDQICV